jgi:outer membrane immunogenic protein
MSSLKPLALAALLGAASISGAHAADAITVPVSDTSIPVYNEPSYDWTGFYAGVYGVGEWTATPTSQYGGGLALGYLHQLDFFVLGVEGDVQMTWNGAGTSFFYGQGLARGGLVVTDQLVAYLAAGAGSDFAAAPQAHALVGGGLELAATEDISVRAQYLFGIGLNAASANKHQASLGVLYHF